jgi:FkbM family methyltransferase
VNEDVVRSDLDCTDHEDWIYGHIAVPAGGTYVDVGAFVGTHAIRIAKDCKANVYAFEPVDEHVELININQKLNDVAITVIPAAVGDCSHTVTFHPGGPGGSYVVESQEQAEGILGHNVENFSLVSWSASDRFIPVEMTTLDRAMQAIAGIDRIDVVKIDVEGLEIKVLDGAVEIAARFKPKFIVEVHSHYPHYRNNGNEIVRWCEENGYNFKWIWDNGGGYFYVALTPKG